MDLDAFFAENPMGGVGAVSPQGFKSGFVALVGRPNAGKSTLLNAMMGKKIAITSNTAQTTRHRFRAALTTEDFQLVIVDTPGIHKPHDALGEELNVSAENAIGDVDVVALLVDTTKPIGRGDEWVAARVREARGAKVCVLTKTDRATPEQVRHQLEAARSLADWDAITSLSAQEGTGVAAFIDLVAGHLPAGPKWFPDDMDTDLSEEVMVAEFIREKVLLNYRDEVPHAIGVGVEQMEYVRKKDLMRIFAVIYVERESQKGIIIGQGGRAVRQVGIEARCDLEQLLGCRVFLDLSVKCKKDWRRDANQIRRFGYGE